MRGEKRRLAARGGYMLNQPSFVSGGINVAAVTRKCWVASDVSGSTRGFGDGEYCKQSTVEKDKMEMQLWVEIISQI